MMERWRQEGIDMGRLSDIINLLGKEIRAQISMNQTIS
jgi:hypothetical protein